MPRQIERIVVLPRYSRGQEICLPRCKVTAFRISVLELNQKESIDAELQCAPSFDRDWFALTLSMIDGCVEILLNREVLFAGVAFLYQPDGFLLVRLQPLTHQDDRVNRDDKHRYDYENNTWPLAGNSHELEGLVSDWDQRSAFGTIFGGPVHRDTKAAIRTRTLIQPPFELYIRDNRGGNDQRCNEYTHRRAFLTSAFHEFLPSRVIKKGGHKKYQRRARGHDYERRAVGLIRINTQINKYQREQRAHNRIPVISVARPRRGGSVAPNQFIQRNHFLLARVRASNAVSNIHRASVAESLVAVLADCDCINAVVIETRHTGSQCGGTLRVSAGHFQVLVELGIAADAPYLAVEIIMRERAAPDERHPETVRLDEGVVWDVIQHSER